MEEGVGYGRCVWLERCFLVEYEEQDVVYKIVTRMQSATNMIVRQESQR